MSAAPTCSAPAVPKGSSPMPPATAAAITATSRISRIRPGTGSGRTRRPVVDVPRAVRSEGAVSTRPSDRGARRPSTAPRGGGPLGAPSGRRRGRGGEGADRGGREERAEGGGGRGWGDWGG